MEGKKFELFFKAGRKASSSCDSYRQIIKREATDENDMLNSSDDVITLPILEMVDGKLKERHYWALAIDCDKKTGEFRLFGSYTI